jgi:hypothetical protein
LRGRLEEIRANEFPTETPELLGEIIAKLLRGIERVVAESDEPVQKFALLYLRQLGSHLELIQSATSQLVPASMIAATEAFVATLFPDSRILLRVQPSFNYTVLEIVDRYKTALRNLLLPEELDDALSPIRSLYVVSLPAIARSSILLHTLLGHEFGHRLASDFLSQEDQPALISSIRTRLGDLRWFNPNIDQLPPLFQTPIRQQILEQMLLARRRALEELISDAVGYELFGPSMLFALDAFSAADSLDVPPRADSFYPPWRMRIRRLLSLAETDQVETEIVKLDGPAPIPMIRDSAVKRLARLRSDTSSLVDLEALQRDELLKRAYEDVPTALERSLPFVQRELGQHRFIASQPWVQVRELLERISQGIPPDATRSGTPDFRAALLAGWLYQSATLPVPFDSPHAWSSTDDAVLERLILKALESIQVTLDFTSWQRLTHGSAE